MFVKPGLAPHAGKTYIPELTHFAGTPAEMTALATGDLDCAALAYSTFALGIENAGMKDLRIIADEFQDGVPGYHTNDFVVRKDSPIKTVEDLKGKILASNQTGSAVDMALRAMLAKHHLQDKRDLTIIEVRFPDQKAMLKEGKVDLITAVLPFGQDPELLSMSRSLFTQDEAMGRSQMIVRVARDGFLQKHRAEMVDFLEDYLHALHYLQRPRASPGGAGDHRRGYQAEAVALRGLGLHKKGLLPRPQWATGPGGAAGQCRSAAQARFLALTARGQEIRRPQPRETSRGRPSSRGSSLKGGAGGIEL